MAEEHVGAEGQRPAAWTKIFTGFKVALDLKKLLLAAAGVLAVWLAWWFVSWVAYGLVRMPDWDRDYADRAKGDKASEVWTEFQGRRASWNLLHELAGAEPLPVEPADVAVTLSEYEALRDAAEGLRRYHESVKVVRKDKELRLEVGPSKKQYPFTIVSDPKDVLKDETKNVFPLPGLEPEPADHFRLGNGADFATIHVTANADELKEYRGRAATLVQQRAQAKTFEEKRRRTVEAALTVYEAKLLPRTADGPLPIKPYGRLRSSPFSEYRGENPYLFVTGLIKETAAAEPTGHPVAVPHASFLTRVGEMVPVLLEPIVKILTPIVYLFHRAADWYVQLYLIVVLLLALAIWGFFGGAITRLAAVQIARNEKLPLREAVLFARDHFVSFFAAPAFPLLLLGILVLCLWVFGWVEGLIPIFGDIIVAGLLWPIVLVVGLIMAVVLVGLVGWPLMNATISTEGSDSFDALSRSYSYVYQAPWHYLWYGAVATLYGIVLVFFVGFMASLLVFLGKWGVGMTPGLRSSRPENDREPSYLFNYAPESFGWRNLLIHNNQFVVPEPALSPRGVPITRYEFKQDYLNSMRWYNQVGAWLVAIWIGAFFLLVVGFGYSYFWTAATLIYFLMRRQVDDTDLDEVHLDEDDALDPFARPPAPAATAPAPKSDKVSLQVVEPPALRTGITPAPPPIVPPPPPAPAPPPVTPPAALTPAPPPIEPPPAPPPPERGPGEPPPGTA